MIIIDMSARQAKIERKKVMVSAGRLINFAKSAVPPKRRTQMLTCKMLLLPKVISFRTYC
jgi:hypothetical protein